MKLELFVLSKSKKLGIDNSQMNIIDLQDKLREEFQEAMYEAEMARVHRNTKIKANTYKCSLAAELLDVIQVCISGLAMLEKENVDIKLAFDKHIFKLITEREWEYEKVIDINLKDI